MYRRPVRGAAAGVGVAALLVAAGALYSRHLTDGHFHGDESFWLYYGRVYFDLAAHGDFDDPAWTEPEHPWKARNPTVGKLLLGAAVSPGLPPAPGVGEARATAQLGFNPEGMDFRWGASNPGRVPAPRLLARGRLVSLASCLVAALALFFLAARVGGAFAGWAAAALFLAHPITVWCATLALPDALLAAFTLLATLATVRLADEARPRLGAALAAGLAWGLALSTKLSALAPFGGALLVAALQSTRPSWSARLGKDRLRLDPAWLVAGGVLGAAAVAVFFGTNPFLWRHPFSKLGLHPTHLEVLFQHTQRIPWEWSTEPAVAAAQQVGGAARALFAAGPIGALLAVLVAAGLAAGPGRWRLGELRGPGAWAVMAGAAALLTVFTLPMAVERFYLPLLPHAALVAGVGASRLWRLAAERRRAP